MDSTFFDQTLDFGIEPGDTRQLARRQFMFSLMIAVGLVLLAGILGARNFAGSQPGVALHQIVIEPEPGADRG